MLASALPPLYCKTLEFVKVSTKMFDESHNYQHAQIVYANSKKIMDSFNFEYDDDILMFAALLHDVCDHKYPKSITLGDLESFIRKYVPNKADIIMKIISNVSYSKEVAGKREELTFPYNIYLDAISDADKIEALGKKGIERCEIFTRAKGGRVPQDVIQHCYDKLLRLYTEGFIRTEMGKTIAKPLHDEVVDYVEENTKV
jgi:HD superfamily phosphodiesterase